MDVCVIPTDILSHLLYQCINANKKVNHSRSVNKLFPIPLCYKFIDSLYKLPEVLEHNSANKHFFCLLQKLKRMLFQVRNYKQSVK